MNEQNLKNHTRFVPAFHFFVLPILAINLGSAIYRVIHLGFSFASVFGVLLVVALLLLAFYGRLFALAVQDRLIRLEERL